MTNVEALGRLYAFALGGALHDFADAGVRTNVEALRMIYAKYTGGAASDVADLETSAEIIDAIAFGKSGSITVEAMPSDGDLWGTQVSAIQSEVTVTGKAISGTLTMLTEGQLVTDWGEGYFIALHFGNGSALATSTKVGLDPTQGSGLVTLEDDRDAVLKIDDKYLKDGVPAQKLLVVQTDGVNVFTEVYDLSGLVLAAPKGRGAKGVKSK